MLLSWVRGMTGLTRGANGPELEANCGLSLPTVITGRHYDLHVMAPEFQVHHVYRFGDDVFEVTILCEGLQ